MKEVTTITDKIGRMTIHLHSEVIDREVLDTEVIINGQIAFHIAGIDRHQFLAEFKRLVEKYQI